MLFLVVLCCAAAALNGRPRDNSNANQVNTAPPPASPLALPSTSYCRHGCCLFIFQAKLFSFSKAVFNTLIDLLNLLSAAAAATAATVLFSLPQNCEIMYIVLFTFQCNVFGILVFVSVRSYVCTIRTYEFHRRFINCRLCGCVSVQVNESQSLCLFQLKTKIDDILSFHFVAVYCCHRIEHGEMFVLNYHHSGSSIHPASQPATKRRRGKYKE